MKILPGTAVRIRCMVCGAEWTIRFEPGTPHAQIGLGHESEDVLCPGCGEPIPDVETGGRIAVATITRLCAWCGMRNTVVRLKGGLGQSVPLSPRLAACIGCGHRLDLPQEQCDCRACVARREKPKED